MEIIRYEKLTGPELARIVTPGDVILVPLSAPENHGEHLPLGTDLMISEEICNRAARFYASRYPQSKIFYYPAISIGGATIRGRGSVKVKSRDLRKCLKFFGRRLILQGFRKIVFLSAHGGLPHVEAMDAACRTLTRIIRRKGAGGAVAPFSRVMGNVFAGLYLGDWQAKGVKVPQNFREEVLDDLHAGYLETSMLLAIDPEWMGEKYRSVEPLLPPRRLWLDCVERGIAWGFRKSSMPDGKRLEGLTGLALGKNDFSWIIRGRKEGYSGRPALATAELGQALLNSISEDVAVAMEEIFEKSVHPGQYRSAAYWFGWLKIVGIALAVAIAAGTYYLSR